MEQPATEAQQLTNEHVQVLVHHKPACVVEYEVEAQVGLVKNARKRAVKVVAKEVTLPGFRKGKAPDELILKNFPGDVDKQWQEEIADEAFRESQKLAKIPLISRDARVTFRMKAHSLDKGATLSLSFETEPNIPSVDPKQFEPKTVKRPEANDEKVSETIRQVQLFFATWEQITSRPVQEGDFILLDVDVIEEMPPSPLFSNTRFEVADKSMAKWMRDLVIGKTVGETVEGVSVPDDDASLEDKEDLKPKKVRIHIKAIEEPKMPELNDDFAKRLGAGSVEEMRNTILQLLTRQADAHFQEAMREQASEFMLTKFPFELPASLIEKETHFRMKQLIGDPDFKKYWENLSDDERKKTLQTIYQQSEKAVRMFYLCRKVISDAKIRISAEDLPPSPTTPLEMLLTPQKLHHHQQNPEIQHAEAFSRLVLEKAEDWIIANGTSGS